MMKIQEEETMKRYKDMKKNTFVIKPPTPKYNSHSFFTVNGWWVIEPFLEFKKYYQISSLTKNHFVNSDSLSL